MVNREVIETPQGWSVPEPSPDLLTDLLEEFDTKVRMLGVDLDTVLRPGISRDEVYDRLGAVDLVPPDELVVLYGWHNGMRVDERGKYLGLPPFLHHAHLAWVVDAYSYNVARMVPMGLWAEKWVPLESNKGLAAYCADDPRAAPLLRRQEPEEYDFISPTTEFQIASMCTMVTWWIEAIDSGARRPTFNNSFLDWTFDSRALQRIDRGTMILV